MAQWFLYSLHKDHVGDWFLQIVVILAKLLYSGLFQGSIMDECTVMSHFMMKFFTNNSMVFVKSPSFFKVGVHLVF